MTSGKCLVREHVLGQCCDLTRGLPPLPDLPLSLRFERLWSCLAPPCLWSLLLLIRGKQCEEVPWMYQEPPVRPLRGIRAPYREVDFQELSVTGEVQQPSQGSVNHTAWRKPASTSPRGWSCVQAPVSTCAPSTPGAFCGLTLLTLLTHLL